MNLPCPTRLLSDCPLTANLTVSNLTATSATFNWTITDNGSIASAGGQVCYGTDPENLQFNSVLEINDLSSHSQTIPNGGAAALNPDTVYYYEVKGTNSVTGDCYRTTGSFTTVSNLRHQETWPEDANQSEAYGGLLFGAPVGGTVGASNSLINIEHDVLFTAQETGLMTSVGWQNRILSTALVNSRCASSGLPVWCDCVNAGLTGGECGYTIGNSYANGNGGLIYATVHDDDGSGNPDESITLAESIKYTPYNEPESQFVDLPLDNAVELFAGCKYHIVLHNDATPLPITNQLTGMDHADAANQDPNTGAIALNGVTYSTNLELGPERGPWLDRECFELQSRFVKGGTWENKNRTVFPWFEYKLNGQWIGYSYAVPDSLDYSVGAREIEGNSRARQVIPMPSTKTVTGLHLSLSFNKDGSANGQPMTGELKDSTGTVLGTVTYAFDASLEAVNSAGGNFRDEGARRWYYQAFANSITLQSGQTYFMEFSAPAGAGFILPTTIRAGGFFQRNKNHWDYTDLQASTDSGMTWGDWHSSWQDTRTLQMAFTLDGLPLDITGV